MLDFRPISLNDRALIEEYLNRSPYHQINCSFDVFYIWRKVGNVYFCIAQDLLFIQGRDPDGSCWYFFPFGSGNPITGLELIWKDYLHHRDERAQAADLSTEDLQHLPCYFRVVGVRKEQWEAINKQAFTNLCDIELIATPQRDLFEYIYWADSFRGFKGKALQSKRNFVNYALKHFQPVFEPIRESILEECERFVEGFGSADVGFDADSFVQDQGALLEALHSYPQLNLYGGVLRIEGKIEALFIGTPLSDFSTLAGLFMRANHAFKGLVPLLFQEVLIRHTEYTYINLDADVGQEGLRKNKLSYLPDHLIEIYEIRTPHAGWMHYTGIEQLPASLWDTHIAKGQIWLHEDLMLLSEKMGADIHYLVKTVHGQVQALGAFTREGHRFEQGAWECSEASYWFDPEMWEEAQFKEEAMRMLRIFVDPEAEVIWEDEFQTSRIVLPPLPEESNTPEELLELYIGHLKSKYRNELRKYTEAYHRFDLSWEVCNAFEDKIDEIYPLYLETVSRAKEYAGAAYPLQYFHQAKQILGDRARMILLRDEQKQILGFMLLYFEQDTCVMQYTGSKQVKEYYPWHVMTLWSIAYAWSQKTRVIHLGITHAQGKKQFGAITAEESI